MKPEIKAGDECWLELNDHLDTRQQVTVIRVYKGGNALVHDGVAERQCAVADLRKIDKREMGGCAMNLPETCPFCGAGVRAVKDANQRWVEFECFSTIGDVGGEFQYRSPICRHAELNAAKTRLAEMEAREVAALARLAAKDARIESSRLENEAVRRQLGRAEEACDAMEKRVAELEARCKRLEEAARAVYLDMIASDHPWSTNETSNMHALRDVLEAKP